MLVCVYLGFVLGLMQGFVKICFKVGFVSV